MPDVTLPPSATPLPDDVQILSEPPALIEPLLNATLLPFPYITFAQRLLNDHQVAVIPGSVFGDGGRGFTRLTVAVSLADLQRGLIGLQVMLKRLG